jgi:ubiquinol-cytochrome c reductase cytochrome c subunit
VRAGVVSGRNVRRWALLALAALCAAAAVWDLAGSGASKAQTGPGSAVGGGASAGRTQSPGLVRHGRDLFVDGCSSCHGLDARGRPGQGPSVRAGGAASADFYLSTGRMPLDDPNEQPLRTKPAYSRADIDALVAYVGSLGGPPIPKIDPARGDLNEGFRAFASNCAGCHQTVARGGIAPGALAPPLQDATPTQIAEAVRVGPYLMPSFSERQIDQPTLDSIVRYVRSTRDPDDRGGWGIGHIGPIPEGMVAWLLAGVALLLVARVIGERTE